MFGKKDANAHRGEVEVIAATLSRRIAALPVGDRTIVLLLANAALGLASRLHGKVAERPSPALAVSAVAALDGMLPARRKMEAMGDGGVDSERKAVVCFLLAVDVAVATVGIAVAPDCREVVVAAWAALWRTRDRARDAVLWVRNYENETGVAAVPPGPDGNALSDIDLLRLAGTVPAFLRRPSSVE